jgi:short-subunit dehydrogenase
MALALITGASNGIGLEFARNFAADNHDLILVARSQNKLAELAQGLEKAHKIKCHVIACDLSRHGSALELYNRVKSMQLQPEFLVNNAGFGDVAEFATAQSAKLEEMMTLNMETLTLLTRYFLGDMVRRRVGRVLNVASTAAFQPGPYMAVYYATKAYVLSLTEALSVELRDTGVSVTALCPGPVITGFQNAANMADAGVLKLPVLLPADEVAKIGYRAMLRGRAMVIAGRLNWLGAFSVRFSPRRLVALLAARLNKSKPKESVA